MNYTDEYLDLTQQKIKNLEISVSILQDNVSQLTEALRDTQRYLVKLASHHQDLTKRVSAWPFVNISSNKSEDKK